MGAGMSPDGTILRAASVILALAALGGAFVAWVTYGIETASARNPPTGPLTWQLIVAMIGLAPAGFMVYFSFTGASRKVMASLVIGLAIWAAWGVLNDAAVHGWDSDMVLMP